ncbi:MAG: Crp/Fnr family transcriptional regulator [Candidatus Roizmanbacteria bacterium]
MNIEPVEKLTKFFEQYRLTTFKKGENIYRPGDLFEQISFIKSGFVRTYSVSESGEERTIHIFKPVFYFSLIYSLTDKENKYYFEAVTPVELWKAPKSKVIEFIKSDPEILFWITKSILKGFHELMENIEYLIAGDAPTKINSLLLSFAQSFGEIENNSTVIQLAATHRIIASLTGLSRETVTLHIDKLKDQGILEKKEGLIVIHKLSELQEESTFADSV